MTIRKMMIDWMIRNEISVVTTDSEQYQSYYKYYDAKSDEDLFDEFRRDVYREGQDSMSWR